MRNFGAPLASHLRVHIQRHFGTFLQCNLYFLVFCCDFVAGATVQLRKPTSLKHQHEKTFKCLMCNVGATLACQLRVHIHKHIGTSFSTLQEN